MHGPRLLPLVLAGVVVGVVSPSCKSKVPPTESGVVVNVGGGSADAAAQGTGDGSATPDAEPTPVSDACTTDADCQPMNCCFALKPEACVTRARNHCDAFQVKCEPYTGPKYACACVKGACTGNPDAVNATDAGRDESWATGTLEPRVVLASIIKHGPDIRACHAAAKKPSGQVSMHWAILPSGKVDKAAVVVSSVGSVPLTTCLTKKVSAWRFPASKGQTQVSYDFRFSR
jgi:hypothetical protein